MIKLWSNFKKVGNFIDKAKKSFNYNRKLEVPLIEQKNDDTKHILVYGYEGVGKTSVIDFLTDYSINHRSFLEKTVGINTIRYDNLNFYDTPGLAYGECYYIEKSSKHFLNMIRDMDSLILVVNDLDDDRIKEILDLTGKLKDIGSTLIIIKTNIMNFIDYESYEDVVEYLEKRLKIIKPYSGCDYLVYPLCAIKRDLYLSALNKKWGYDPVGIRSEILEKFDLRKEQDDNQGNKETEDSSELNTSFLDSDSVDDFPQTHFNKQDKEQKIWPTINRRRGTMTEADWKKIDLDLQLNFHRKI